MEPGRAHDMSLPSLGGAMAALSVATDFAMAQSAHFGMRSCALAVRLADAMGWSEQDTRRAYFQALLRYVGCNVESEVIASVVGDEMAMRRDFAGIDAADRQAVASLVVRRLREAHAGMPAWRLAGKIVGTLLTAEKTMAGIFAGHCEVGRRLATRIGFDDATVQSLGQLYERWDGRGLPQHLRGEAVSPAALLVTLAQDVVVHHDAGGTDAAVAVVRQRRGSAYAPAMADAFLRHARPLLADLDSAAGGRAVNVPGGDEPLDDARFDAICEAMADFVDIKSPWTLSHSSGVATLAQRAARQLGLPDAEATLPCCTTWARWACRRACGASPRRCRRRSGSRCGCMPTTPSAFSRVRLPLRRWPRWRASRTTGSTAAGTSGGRRQRGCRWQRAFWPRPTTITR